MSCTAEKRGRSEKGVAIRAAGFYVLCVDVPFEPQHEFKRGLLAMGCIFTVSVHATDSLGDCEKAEWR